MQSRVWWREQKEWVFAHAHVIPLGGYIAKAKWSIYSCDKIATRSWMDNEARWRSRQLRVITSHVHIVYLIYIPCDQGLDCVIYFCMYVCTWVGCPLILYVHRYSALSSESTWHLSAFYFRTFHHILLLIFYFAIYFFIHTARFLHLVWSEEFLDMPVIKKL